MRPRALRRGNASSFLPVAVPPSDPEFRLREEILSTPPTRLLHNAKLIFQLISSAGTAVRDACNVARRGYRTGRLVFLDPAKLREFREEYVIVVWNR